jgi:hypothetical protein
MDEKNDKRSVSVWLSTDLVEEIEGEAAKRGMSRSAFLSFFLDRGLSGRAGKAYEQLVAEGQR